MHQQYKGRPACRLFLAPRLRVRKGLAARQVTFHVRSKHSVAEEDVCGAGNPVCRIRRLV